ncbi:MAG: DUF5615 family PIN-like protein [Thermoanaerobaculia bacterium]
MTGFLVKLDENLSRLHVQFLRGLGYEADRVHDQGLSGASDEIVWKRVCAEGRFLITLDLDFSDVRRFEPGTHPGILLIRARNNSAIAVLEILRRVVSEQPLLHLQGCLAVADPNLTRIRRVAGT